MAISIKSLKLACFSPTGTTKRILEAISRGINHDHTDLIDLTVPGERSQKLQTFKDELLVVAVPVYMGRVPALLLEWLNGILADGSPTVCVVVYGNRAYEDALIELNDILIKRGCIPIAGAAYIGEHSYSSSAIPIAEGRPDAGDLDHADYFGQLINKKLGSFKFLDQIPELDIPGNPPDEGATRLWSIDFISVSKDCIQCGICSGRCPVGAIDANKSHLIDNEKCITCCACIKNCPQKARRMKPGPVKNAAMRLGRIHQERKEPDCYI